MVSKVQSLALSGLEGRTITVEVDLHQGLPAFHIVGLPGQAVQESRIRVAAALKNSGFKLPLQKIVVNLAPADVNKSGSNYDLAIAVGILLASRQIRFKSCKAAFWGELSLTGETTFSQGALPIVAAARKHDFQEIFIPDINAQEAGIIAGINIKPVKSLVQLVNNFSGIPIPEFHSSNVSSLNYLTDPAPDLDFSAIRGQQQAKRGLVIAAAGGHNILFKGPPGTGKTHLSRTVSGILPALTFEEMLAVTKIYSIAGLLGGKNMITSRPFRSPHHTASQVAVIGGGSCLKPGEITLAHKGILFLDEFTEFPAALLEALRQPLEDQIINLSRSSGTVIFPADFMLIAAMNPCKCGYYEDPGHVCTCTAAELNISGKRSAVRFWTGSTLRFVCPGLLRRSYFGNRKVGLLILVSGSSWNGFALCS